MPTGAGGIRGWSFWRMVSIRLGSSVLIQKRLIDTHGRPELMFSIHGSLLCGRSSCVQSIYPCRFVRREPNSQHQRAFENKTVGMGGPRQAVQKPLHGIILEQLIKRPFIILGTIEESVPNRCQHIPCGFHTLASR